MDNQDSGQAICLFCGRGDSNLKYDVVLQLSWHSDCIGLGDLDEEIVHHFMNEVRMGS